MSRGQNPLIWMVAVSLPGASHALGLGELHVDSALNEPLAAEIDIVGATPEELATLSAKMGSRETFGRFNVDRPAFLSTTTFKVVQDAHGRPVLAIRSSDSFTEPLVNFVVDLRWHHGELVRQYTLLLDPAGFNSGVHLAQSAPVTSAPAPSITVGPPASVPVLTSAPSASTPEASAPAEAPSATTADSAPVSAPVKAASEAAEATASTRKMTHLKVGAKATLRGIAWRVGARSDTELKRTMLAIFRANPSAFEGNINILHRGAVLTIPSAEAVGAIDKNEARREIHAQMAAWRNSLKTVAAAAAPRQPIAEASAPKAATPAAAQVQPTPSAPPVGAAQRVPVPPPAAAPMPVAPYAEAETLKQRIKSLEDSLQSVQSQLESQHNRLLNLQAQARYTEQQATAAPASVSPDARGQHSYWSWILGAAAAIVSLAGAVWLRLRSSKPATRYPEGPRMPAFVDPARETLKPEPARVEPAASPRVEVRAEPPVAPAQLPAAADPEETIDTVEVESPAAAMNAEPADEAEARLQAELERAWSIPAAEEYRRSDEEEHTLAEAIAKSLADTAKLRAIAAQEAAAAEETTLTANHTMINQTDTAVLPAATVVMDAAAVRQDLQQTEVLPAVAAPNTETPAGKPAIDAKNVDYNLMELDRTAQHVQMPSLLHQSVVVKERRTSLIDVLKMAIEREPERRDLRMKLLETYFAAAATNRRAFLEAVSQITSDGRNMKEADWERIHQMGRQIAADSALFDDKPEDDENLADCA